VIKEMEDHVKELIDWHEETKSQKAAIESIRKDLLSGKEVVRSIASRFFFLFLT
jgi:hypothetical protein